MVANGAADWPAPGGSDGSLHSLDWLGAFAQQRALVVTYAGNTCGPGPVTAGRTAGTAATTKPSGGGGRRLRAPAVRRRAASVGLRTGRQPRALKRAHARQGDPGGSGRAGFASCRRSLGPGGRTLAASTGPGPPPPPLTCAATPCIQLLGFRCGGRRRKWIWTINDHRHLEALGCRLESG